MLFVPTFTEWDPHARRWTKRPTTNEWDLCTGKAPVATINWGKKLVPYYADFDIAVKAISTNQCQIAVRTIWQESPTERRLESMADGQRMKRKFHRYVRKKQMCSLKLRWRCNCGKRACPNSLWPFDLWTVTRTGSESGENSGSQTPSSKTNLSERFKTRRIQQKGQRSRKC